MAIIKTKVPSTNGYRASVLFVDGVGKTDDPRLIEWFKRHGYIVETETSVAKEVVAESIALESLDINELKALAKARGVFFGNTKDRNKMIEKLKEVM